MGMKTAQAGTLESMDCLVTASEVDKGRGISVSMEGASVTRFGAAILKSTKETLKKMDIKDMKLSIQDNGATDLVLKARVEAAASRLLRGDGR
jgi:citrate lyase subunit gamma (acyl carrier protein)